MFGKRILSCYKGTADYDLMNVVFVNNNRLLTSLAWAVLENIGPRSWQYGPSEARSVLPRPQANIPQYGPSKRG